VESGQVSPVPGAEHWSYGAYQEDSERKAVTVPLVRDDGASAEFTVPEFVADPQGLRQIALVVIEAFEKWEKVEGLGA
jgi:hypothetical protein